MIIELIVLLIFLASVSGIFFLLSKKIPALLELPERGHHGIIPPKSLARLRTKIKDKHFHFFKKQMLLHGILSRSRVLILRLEKQVDIMLRGIRKKAQELDKKTHKRT